MVLFSKFFKRTVNKDFEIFLDHKEELIKNLLILQFNLEKSIEAGMPDNEDVIYNDIESLLEETESSSELLELREMMAQAKTIENHLDGWLISKGLTTVSINWPSF